MSKEVYHASQDSKVKVCLSKSKYTTLKSVERAKKVLSEAYSIDFDFYKCGDSKHYHLTHKNPSERIGRGNQFNQAYISQKRG